MSFGCFLRTRLEKTARCPLLLYNHLRVGCIYKSELLFIAVLVNFSLLHRISSKLLAALVTFGVSASCYSAIHSRVHCILDNYCALQRNEYFRTSLHKACIWINEAVACEQILQLCLFCSQWLCFSWEITQVSVPVCLRCKYIASKFWPSVLVRGQCSH